MTCLVDTHAHLYSRQFDLDRHLAVERAIEQGVKQIFLPNVDNESLPRLYDLAANYPQHCFATIGLHPCSVKDDFEQLLEKMAQDLTQPPLPIYGIGETGLDYYWDLTHVEQQKKALQMQIAWAKHYHIPIILHTREAFDDTYNLIAQANDDTLRGIFHCFSDGIDEAKKVMALGGFYMGIGGNITYKKSGMAEVVEQIPLEYIVLETDAPYLTPEPYRSSKNKSDKRNEPAHIAIVAQKIAEIKKITFDEVAAITTQNAQKIFANSLQPLAK